MGHNKVHGKMLDRLCDDKVFYVERGRSGFLIVEGCNSAYFTTLSPWELMELGAELLDEGSKALTRWER